MSQNDEKAFEAWQQKQRNKELMSATLRQSKEYSKKILRIITKYDNLFQDLIDENKQFLSNGQMQEDFFLCIRLMVRILDDNFD